MTSLSVKKQSKASKHFNNAHLWKGVFEYIKLYTGLFFFPRSMRELVFLVRWIVLNILRAHTTPVRPPEWRLFSSLCDEAQWATLKHFVNQ